MYINAMYIHPNHLTNSRLPDGPPPPLSKLHNFALIINVMIAGTSSETLSTWTLSDYRV